MREKLFDHSKPGGHFVGLLSSVAILLLLATACSNAQPLPTPTPDYAALETQVAQKLQGTLAVKAPTATATLKPTRTPTVTPSPSATPTATLAPTALPTSAGPWLAWVRTAPEQPANIVLYDLAQKKEEPLTRFVEPMNMSDVAWSKDGEWLIFVSAHDFIHSRNNERNVFIVRPDGTDLQMVTGEYMNPDSAPGPYVTLRGQVTGVESPCIVCAQGAVNPTTTDEQGNFDLPGVPISAQWARAVCQANGATFQGDVDLEAVGESLEPVSIAVEAKGQGWAQAVMTRDGGTIAGISYEWTFDAEGKQQYVYKGVLLDSEGAYLGDIETPPETILNGLEWLPTQDELTGALSGEKSTLLWRWDAQGKSIGSFIEIPNEDREILSITSPAWSPDGSQLAFGLRRWYWWGENQYKTEIMVVAVNGQNLRSVVQTDWGVDATHPYWSADGKLIYYQLSTGAPEDDFRSKSNGNIWAIPIAGDAPPTPITSDNASYYPAARPGVTD